MNKRRFRVLNTIDGFNRQALVVDGHYSFPGNALNRQMDRAIHEYGIPQSIRVDNRPEFTCSTFIDWFTETGICIE